MKIAITGHTAGIGEAFTRRLSSHGHEIVGISRRDGHNIRNIPKTVALIIPCDMWINNAQAGFAQTELLHQVWRQWRDCEDKSIWLISTILTTYPGLPSIDHMTDTGVAEYKNQKRALEDSFYQLRALARNPQMLLIRPGAVSTQPDQHGADVDEWVDTVVDCYQQATQHNLAIEEISLGFRPRAIKI